MSQQPGGEPRPGFWSELRQRKVVRVAISYLVAGWVVIEVSLTVFPEFGVPAWANRLVVLLVALGFPVSLALAWVFELTPEGLKVTDEARRRYGPEQETDEAHKRRNRMAVLLGSLAPAVLVGAALGAGLAWTLLRGEPAAPAAAEPIVAVLPFANLSPDPDNEFFAGGVHEELLTRLAAVNSLRVISRTSVMRYQRDPPGIAEIGAALGATHIVEGSVRRAGDSVRITAQLIEVATDQHVWADSFDRELEDALAIQTRVATSIVAALQASLTPQEASALETVGTRSAAAYDLYLRAKTITNRFDGTHRMIEEPITLLRQAVRIDPAYADAWQLLAELEAWWVHAEKDPTGEHLAAAGEALARSRQLAPGAPATLMAEAYFRYHGQRRYEDALALTRRARELAPGLPQAIELEGYLLRRMGQFEEARASLEEALLLDPLNATIRSELANYLLNMERYEEALEQYRSLAGMNPSAPLVAALLEEARFYTDPALAEWERLTDARRARATEQKLGFLDAFLAFQHLVITGRFDEAAELAATAPLVEFETPATRPAWTAYHRARALDFLGRRAEAREAAAEALRLTFAWEAADRETWGSFQARLAALFKAYLAAYLGQHELAARGLAVLEADIAADHDRLNRKQTQYFYIEALLASEPERAVALYLESERDAYKVIPIHLFCSGIHLWYPILDSAEARAKFERDPEWIAFLAGVWPDERPWPFAQSGTNVEVPNAR